MAVQDTIAFIQERMRVFNPDLDVERGGDFYQKVLLPLQQRLGPDLFTTDVRAFLLDLLTRNFPDLALSQLDALAEAVVVPLEVALGPITAEITRVNRVRSLRNPDQLTVEEADDLGANFLQEREQGNTARGVARLYFNHPQTKRVDLTHVFTTNSNLAFVPTEVQTITAEEMLLNQEGSLYFMTVSLIAAAPGDQYNIEPHQITSVRGLNGVVRVTNLSRFQGGLPEQTAEEFVAELPARVGSEGMTQPSGIVNALKRSFPALTRIAVVGHGDPEMQRDVLQGESLGRMHAFGFHGRALGDNEGRPTTRLFYVDEVLDGAQLLSTFPLPLVLSLAHSSLNPKAQDVRVRRIVADNTLELEESVIPLDATGIVWSLRAREVLLSKTAGLDLDSALAVPPDQVHVGGAVDVYLRGATFSPTTTVIDVLDDARPALEGLSLEGTGTEVGLMDLVLGTDYQEGDATQDLVRRIWSERWALEILNGPAQGIYDILDVQEQAGSPLALVLYTPIPVSVTGARWRILDNLHVDLLAPRKHRWSDDDLETTQGLDVVASTSLVSYLDLGVEVGDTLEILDGRDKGTYQIQAITGPGNTRLQLNQSLSKTGSGVSYRIYKENTAAPLETPVIRPTKVELLSPTGQALGVTVPYGGCLGGISQGLSNSGNGVKLEVPDALLGLISQRLPSGANVSGQTMTLFIENTGTYTVTFSGANPVSLASIASQINAAVGKTIAAPVYDRLGIFPLGRNAISTVGPSSNSNNAVVTLFGGRFRISTRSIRSPSFTTTTFTNLSPSLSLDYDVVQFRDGGQIGVHGIERVTTAPIIIPFSGLYEPTSIVADVAGGFRPEADVRLELGSRSVGVVRTYFMDPVTVEFDTDALFKHVDAAGAELLFRPDAQFSTRILPPPTGAKPKDGNCIGGDNVLNTSIDLRAKRIRKGDFLKIDYVPLFTAALADPVPNLSGQTLIVSYGSENQQTITFVNDDPSLPLTHVTRAGVLSQLQRYFGLAVTEDPGGILRINPEFLLVISRDGTANATLGFSTSAETSNRAQNAGLYEIDIPGNLGCTLLKNLPHAETRMQFEIVRRGSQRIGATAMSSQLGEGGLYYFDVEVVSEGTGNAYNLPGGESFEVTNHFSDGYLLRTPDPSFTFSTRDRIEMELPRAVNPVGTSDDPEEATRVTGMQVQVTADSAVEVREVQQFLSSDSERDVCSSSLALALTPHLLNATIDYIGGPTTAEARAELSTLVHALFPDEELAVDAMVTRLKQMGASSVILPIRLFALLVDRDRRIKLLSSQDRLSVGKQSAFYPNQLTLRRVRG